MSEDVKGRPVLTGVIVIILLAILTAVEFIISNATDGGSLVPLVIIALIKTGLIVQYFMHLPRTLNPDDEGGSH